MPIEIPATSVDAAANQIAQQVVGQALQEAQRRRSILTDGIPAQPAQEARTMPNGQVIAGRPAVAAIPAAKIKSFIAPATLGALETSCADLLD